MKNTNKFLSAGLVLAITVVSTVSAMNIFSKKPSAKKIVRTEEHQEIIDFLEYIATQVGFLVDQARK